MLRGVTNIPESASPPKSPASITVGMPIDTTGTPRLPAAQLLPVVADTGAWGYPRVGHLHSAAEPVGIRAGQCVYGDDE